MSDRADGIGSASGGLRRRARILRTSRRSLHLAGLTALALAAATSAATLLGARSAPSGAFVAQCFAVGTLALVLARRPAWRRAVPMLAVGASTALVLFVVLEVLRGGAVLPVEVAACALLLPLLAVQLPTWRHRLLVVSGAALLVFATAAVVLPAGPALLQLGVALAFVATVALVVAEALTTTRSQQEQRLEELRDTMRAERSRTRSREETIANLSHDLRNPLAIALGFAEMAEDETLGADERAHALSGVRRSLFEMSQMVENVLDGSADRAGALQPTLEPLDLEALCEDALAASRVLLRRRPVTLHGELEPGLLAYADRNRLARVVANLLGNACKYTESGEIHLQTIACGRHAVIRVRDTGPGIAPEAMPHIFDRFRRAHEGGPAGAGLGLAIAHRLTERMGGALEVTSELGVGSTFTVTLPLAAAPQSESVAA